MAAPTKGVPPPPRTAERARLAAAIERKSDAEFQLARVGDALEKIDETIFERLEPAVRRAREDLDGAIAAAPRALVAKALGETPEAGPTVAEAEAALAAASKELADARQARSLLRDEQRHREYAVDQAGKRVDEAAKGVVASDPARQAVLDEFFRCGRRALHCAQILRTVGTPIQGAQAHGLMFRITDAPVPIDRVAFRPDPGWLSALAALREDADAAFPPLPEPAPEAVLESEPAEEAVAA